MRFSTTVLLGGLALAGAGTIALGAAPTPQHAASFQRKVDSIAQGPASGIHRRTEFSGDELNAYLQITAKPQFPAGVTDPVVTMAGEGRLIGRAVVDLDAIRKARSSGSLFDPRAYLTGRLPVTATGVLRARNGTGSFALETAEVSGVPIPKSLLQDIVTYYTTNPQTPNGVNLDQSFALPAGITQISVETDKAIVVQ
jgi:hypothetical protein